MMKHTWKTRASAFLLSAVMVLGLSPMALADDWYHDPDNHWRSDGVRSAHNFTQTSYTPPTCYTPGTRVERCTTCGYEKTTNFEATGNHEYSTTWSKDSSYHWHACTTSGCTAITDRQQHTPIGNGTVTAPTCTEAGYVTYTCSTCGQTYTQETSPALGHDFVNGVCTRCKKTDDAAITITFVNGGSTFQTQSNVRSGAYPANPGTPSLTKTGWTCTFKGWTTTDPGANAVYNGQTLVNVTSTPATASTTYYAVYTVSGTAQNVSTNVSASGNTTVGTTLRDSINNAFSSFTGHNFSTLTFASTSNSSYGTLYANANKKSLTGNTYTYTGGSYPASDLYFQPDSKSPYTASYTVKDDAGNAMSGTVTISTGSNTSTSDGDITYKVDKNGSVTFDRKDFNKFFQKEYSDYDVRWVEFETDDTLNSSKGQLYANYKESKEKSFTQSTIEDYQFYYDSSSYGDYALNNLTFVAGSDSRTVTLTFRAYYSSSRYVKGTVKVIVGSDTTSGDITYKVDKNGSVTFDRKDFNKYFQKEYSDYDVRWVEFETDDTLNSSKGQLYANYKESKEKSFTQSTIEDYQFYYDSSSYGDYALNNLTFVASGESRTVTLTFRAYYSSSRYVKGTVKVIVGDDTSDGDITYKVDKNDKVAFDRADFNKYFQKSYSGYDVRWVEFDTDDTLSASMGTVYSNYKGSNEKSFSRSSIDDYKFYYSSSSYGDYALNDLTFVSGDEARTVTLNFRAYYSDDRYVKGTVKVIVGNDTSSGDITYKVDKDSKVTFDRADFNKYFQKSYSNYDVRWVEFETDDTLSTSMGTVYANYKESKEKSFSRSTISDYKFYYNSSSYGDYALNDLTFVSSDEARTVTLTFRAYYSSDRYVKGTVKIIIGNDTSSGDITYKVDKDSKVTFDRADFNKYFQKSYSNYDVRWVEFDTDDTLSTSMGTLYSNYKGSKEKSYTKSTLGDYKFYYNSSSYGDYALDDLTFVSSDEARTVTLSFRAYYSTDRYVKGTVKVIIGGGSSSSSSGDITYQVAAGEKVDFDRADFNKFFQKKYSDYSVRWVEFSTDDSFSSSTTGVVYADYKGSDEKSFSKSTIDDYKFYYSSSSYGDYSLDKLSFVASSKFDKAITLHFKAYYSDSRYVSGDLVVKPGASSSTGSALISYKAAPSEKVAFNRADFNNAFQKEFSAYTVKYVTFSTDDTLSSSTTGSICFDYKGDNERAFTKSNLGDYKFYYSSAAQGDYALNQLSFVAGGSFSKTVTLKFTAYYSDTRYVSGKVVITPTTSSNNNGNNNSGTTTEQSSSVKGSIRYYATGTGSVQINQNDIARFFQKSYPGTTLQTVTLNGVPSSGNLYYNYYGVSKYGASKLQLTSSNCAANTLYFSPASTAQYALSELTYIPSGTNYCAQIPFTANGGGKSVSGTILISVNKAAVSEVYGATPKGSAVAFPATAISTAVNSATGLTLAGIQLLALPDSAAGTVYVGSGTTTPANTTTVYPASGDNSIAQLRFVPASGYTGSVEIPYAAFDSNGNAITAGKFSLGVVSSVKKFTDVTSSTWCYKYVAELSDQNIISGYADGTFKPNSTVTYGAALKLIMLAAGYPEQKATTSNPFSGYLAKARSEGIITRSNVDLTKPITRLQVAQIAAGALKLDKTNLSSVQPFTDTTDASVRALNAAGIVEGYFAGGTSTYRPNNTLTRGQISAIVWRMKQL